MRDGAWRHRDPRRRARDKTPRGLGIWLLGQCPDEQTVQRDASPERAGQCPGGGPCFDAGDDHQQITRARSADNHRTREFEQTEELRPCREFSHERVTRARRGELGEHRRGSDRHPPRPYMRATALDDDSNSLDTRPRLACRATRNSLES
jgi:hypothetical protein